MRALTIDEQGMAKTAEETLKALLDDGPLVTVLGMGGMGKTRLTLQVAAELLPRFADGAWFVDLSLVRDPALVVGVLAQIGRAHV